jgi:Domain of unknown function (DUF4288)
MPKQPQIGGLDDFGLSLTALSRLGRRPVGLYISLRGETVSRLRHLRPKQRLATLSDTLAKQLTQMRREFPAIAFMSREKDKASWSIDAVVPANQAKQVVTLATKRYVKSVTVDTIEGRRKRVRRSPPSWFCVRATVAVQIEDQVKGSLYLDDQFVLVKAKDPDDAQKRVERMWTKGAEPYMNSDGYLVRWQLIEVRDVHELAEDTIDPGGTEVYSKLTTVRMRPEYCWRPRKKPRVR